MKGVSPLIATILLIAVTVSVAAVVGTWILSFSKTSTESVQQKANLEILCNRGGISLSDVCYSSQYISGYVKNTGTIALGNITIQVLYTNGSQTTYYLSYGGGVVVPNESCCGNMSMLAGWNYKFNVSADSNYEKLHVFTNCTPYVYDDCEASDISTTC